MSVVPSNNWRAIMNLFFPSKSSGLRLLLASAGIMLATSALAAQPTFDPQQQAREIIVPKPDFAAARASAAVVTAAASARAKHDLDAQEQARGFILAKSILSADFVPRSEGQAVSALGSSPGDVQEQARLFILGKPTFVRLPGPAVLSVSKTQVAREAPARSNRRGIGSSE
jgi:hypothetical protein